MNVHCSRTLTGVDESLSQEQLAVVGRVRELAQAQGLDLRVRESRVEMTVDGNTHAWPLIWSSDGGVGDMMSRARPDAFLIAERLTRAAADFVRRAGACFADADGTFYVRAPGVLVDIRGRRLSSREGKHSDGAASGGHPTPPSVNLMSAARAQVVFCVLEWPELLTASVRELAHSAGVSVGSAQGTLAELEDARHLTVGRRQLTRRGELLDQWATAFATGLGRKLELGLFVGDPSPDEWLATDQAIDVSGEYVAQGISGPGITLYVDALDARAVAASRWRRARSADEEANVVIRRRFWVPPGGRGDVAQRGISGAPDLLVYADLIASGDPRQREAARQMRELLV